MNLIVNLQAHKKAISCLFIYLQRLPVTKLMYKSIMYRMYLIDNFIYF